jgi:hypothetical protein
MSNADQFRVYAEEAKRWAHQAKFPATKQALFDLACTWTEAALCAEQRDVTYVQQSGPASDYFDVQDNITETAPRPG